MKRVIFLISLFVLANTTSILAQELESNSDSYFNLKGTVRNADTNAPVSRVNIEITGEEYTTTNNAGEFTISAKIGQELVIKSDNFKTVYYTINDRQKITVLVENVENVMSIKKTSKRINNERGSFSVFIDSANYFLKKDAKKSIEYITKALETVSFKKASNKQKAIAYETLGDINLFWEQYDLAVSNYKRTVSLLPKRKTKNILDVYIKLAQAFKFNSNYQESISTFNTLLKERLSNYQKVEVFEGLGDVYKETKDSKSSVLYYEKGLEVANYHQILPKITDLNSKIADVYAQIGSYEQANIYYDNSLNLAEKENLKRAASEKSKVADFYNQSQDFEKEIQLREETIEDIEEFEDADDMDLEINQSLTPQRQNYKIANAYASQGKTEEAIPFLQKSISEADKSQDLVVEKDATRKLSEIYKDLGEYDKATESYQNYVKLLDELYLIKEQEISQASRFRREIAFKQNRIASLEYEKTLNESRYQLAQENEVLTQKNIKVQRWVIISLVIIALLLVVAAFIQFKSIKQQKLANNLLALKSLRTQMNPHFIFNALNSVNSFIASNDERAANKYLSEFSQLMRSVLENSEEDFIPLEKEIELLQLYVKLEHFRFKDKFEYQIHIDKKLIVEDFIIPPMLLQPYVENAVWHGLRYKKELGNLKINFIQLDDETVKIEIIDDGIGRKKSKELKTENQKKHKSKGMGNVKNRISILNEMYKDKVDVIIKDAQPLENEIGTKVELLLKKD